MSNSDAYNELLREHRGTVNEMMQCYDRELCRLKMDHQKQIEKIERRQAEAVSRLKCDQQAELIKMRCCACNADQLK